MTFLSAHHKPMREQVMQTEVIDLTTGEKIPRVIWANDETGRYRKILTDDTGKILVDYCKNRVMSKIFTGQIELRRKEVAG